MSENTKRPVVSRIDHDELEVSKLSQVKEAEVKSTSQEAIKFPYVIRRIYAAVYQRITVVYTTEKIKPPKQGIAILVDYPVYDANHRLTLKARTALIEVLEYLTRTSGFRMCAVFGEKDAVFVEPDGQVNPSIEAPSGGIFNV